VSLQKFQELLSSLLQQESERLQNLALYLLSENFGLLLIKIKLLIVQEDIHKELANLWFKDY